MKNDFLKEENEICTTCRWSLNGFCENVASEENKKPIDEIELKECDHRYSIYDDEVLMNKRDEEYENLFEELI